MRMTKKCCKCKQVLSLDRFHKNRVKKDGLQGQCKACNIKQMKAWQKQHPHATWKAHTICNARNRAFHEGVPFELTHQNFPDVLPETCPVTGERLSYASGKMSGCSATIDRLIPMLGYTPANIAIVSLSANASKQDHWPKFIEARSNMYPNDLLLQQLAAWVEQRLQDHAADLIDQVKRMIAAEDQQKVTFHC